MEIDNKKHNSVDGFEGIYDLDTLRRIANKAKNGNTITENIVSQSTVEEEVSKKGLMDVFLTPKVKKIIASVLLLLTVAGAAWGLAPHTKAKNICNQEIMAILENNGVVKEGKIVNLDNMKKLVLDSAEDFYLYVSALRETENYGDTHSNLSEYEIMNKVASLVWQEGAVQVQDGNIVGNRCLDAEQLCRYFGYNDMNELEGIIGRRINEIYEGENGAYNLYEYLVDELGSVPGAQKEQGGIHK